MLFSIVSPISQEQAVDLGSERLPKISSPQRSAKSLAACMMPCWIMEARIFIITALMCAASGISKPNNTG